MPESLMSFPTPTPICGIFYIYILSGNVRILLPVVVVVVAVVVFVAVVCCLSCN